MKTKYFYMEPDGEPGLTETQELPVVTPTVTKSYTFTSKKEGKTYSRDSKIAFDETNSTVVAGFVQAALDEHNAAKS